MSLQKVPLRDLLSCCKTKAGITKYFAKGLLEAFAGKETICLFVSYENKIEVNQPHTLNADFVSHSHEEADTQIPLHVLHSISESMFKYIVVESLDTDVLALLMDLVANSHLGVLTSLILHTGTGKKARRIDVVERVESIGKAKCKGLVGLHLFSGSDWGGKFVGIAKQK